METKTYVIKQTTPKLGKEGGSVTMTEKAAKYWLLSGVIALAEAQATSMKKGK